jgi:hypothetical protein
MGFGAVVQTGASIVHPSRITSKYSLTRTVTSNYLQECTIGKKETDVGSASMP